MHHGVLNLNKPAGITSRDAVNLVQRLVRPTKLGHAGTLDPLASGVLVLCLGGATRLVEYVQRMSKRYAATFLLGQQSPTEDIQGEVTHLGNPPIPSLPRIVDAAGRLTGSIEQRPPAFSALKVKGRRAYDLARKGQQVDLKPRTVLVSRFDVVAYDYPELRMEIECGSGTYVRSLGRDLAESLGTGAVMSDLVRTAVGGFRLDEAVDPAALTPENWSRFLFPPLRAVERLPQLELNAHQLAVIRSGQTIEMGAVFPNSPEVAALDEKGRLVSILIARGPRQLGPKRNLPPEAD